MLPNTKYSLTTKCISVYKSKKHSWQWSVFCYSNLFEVHVAIPFIGHATTSQLSNSTPTCQHSYFSWKPLTNNMLPDSKFIIKCGVTSPNFISVIFSRLSFIIWLYFSSSETSAIWLSLLGYWEGTESNIVHFDSMFRYSWPAKSSNSFSEVPIFFIHSVPSSFHQRISKIFTPYLGFVGVGFSLQISLLKNSITTQRQPVNGAAAFV